MIFQNYFKRSDRTPGGQIDRVCPCHFKDGVNYGNPAYFAWDKGKTMTLSDAELREKIKIKNV